MVAVTLHMSDWKKDLQETTEPRSTQLRIVQNTHPGNGRDELPIHYVPDD